MNNKISAEAFVVTSSNDVPTSKLITSTDLYNSASRTYDINVLDKLAEKTLGTGKKLSDLVLAARSGGKDASDFRSANGGNDVTVKFGGIIWTPVYLSTTDGTATGKPILTLWHSGINTSQYTYNTDYSTTQDISPFTDGWYNDSSNSATSTWTTPVGMYGSSYMRAITLNNGGYYSSAYTPGSSSIGNHVSKSSQPTITDATSFAVSDTTNKYYEFTRGDIASLLVAPVEVEWQANQKNSVTHVIANGSNYKNLNNESYNAQGGITYSFEGKTYTTSSSSVIDLYGQWKNDKVWLPSITELGSTDGTSGIWKTSTDQKKTDIGSQASSVKSGATKGIYNYTWLRTGVDGSAYNGYYIKADGVSVNSTGKYANAFAVRPAIHLDLSQIELDAPGNITSTYAYDGTAQPLTYNGTQHTLNYLDPDWYRDEIYSSTDLMEVTYEHIAREDTTSSFDTPQISGSSVDDGIKSSLTVDPAIATTLKNAGKYKVTLKLKSDFLKWEDDTLDYDTATDVQKALQRYRVVEYTIAPKKINVSYSIYDTSGGGSVEKSGTSVVYTADTTKTYKVDIKTTVSTESIPTGTPANRFPDYEIVYSGAANDGTTTYTEVTTVPRLAGSYTAKFKDKNAKTSNYELKCAQTSFAYTVDKAEVSLPTFSIDKQTYNANEQDFALTSTTYDTAILKVDNIKAGSVALTANAAGTEYESADGYFLVKYDAASKKFTATNAEDYKVTFALVDGNNYKWATALATAEKSKTFTVEKKELVIKFKSPLTNNSNFNLKTSTTGNVTADYDTNGGGETPTGGSAEEPVLLLYYTFGSGSKVLVGSSSGDTIGNFTLDVTTLKGVGNKFSAGTYSLAFELAPEAANAVNKNYKLGTSAAQALTVTAGEASIDDIGILYNTVKKEADGEPAVAIPSDGLKYEYDSVSKQATEYKFELDFSNIDYLTYADSVSLQYNNDSTVTQAINAGTLTVTVKIKVKDDEAANHSLPAAFDVTQTNTFKSYTNNGDGTATLTFEVEIGKHEITVAGSDIPLKYQREGGSVEDYDPKNPPEFNGKPVTISLPHESLYPHGIKSIEFDETAPKKTQAGSYTIGATVTLDDNHCLANGGSTVHVDIPWEISKEVIKLAWGKPTYFDDYFNDSSVAHLQVMLLSGLTEVQEGAIKYSFYKMVDGAPDTTPLSEAELKALCTNDRFTDPNETWLYVKAELTEDGAKKYKLEDDATKNPKKFKLGGQMTLIELKVDDEKINGYEYGGELDLSKVFTLINTETGDPWDSSYYEIRVLKDGVDIGELSEFNPAANGAGKYVIQINIKPEYAEDYTLDKSNKVDFEIQRKEIAVPTFSGILFSGEYINLADYLGGSYAEYKDIISLSGDYLELRNVSQNGYTARLTLTDPNYKWAIPTTAEPASLKLFAVKLFDNEISILDDTIAELKWNITPLVIDTTEMWNKSKTGATLNLPENVTKLINAETLSLLYKYYDDAGQYIETPELKGGKSFRVEAVFGGIDAESGNVVFKTADGNFATTSDKISYTVPQSGFAAAMGSTLNFLKANWLWLVIAAAALLFLIILICLIASARKKKRKKEELEEQRRLEKEEREREERKLEREERMARMNQQQQMPQMPQMMMPPMMPQMMPQMMQQQMPSQPQPQPQYAPQQQPMSAGGGMVTEAQFMQVQAELAALKAAQESAKESAILRAEAIRSEAALRAEAAMRNDINAMRSGEVSNINVDAMTEIMTRALKNVMASASQQPVITAPPAQPAQLTDGNSSTATANAVYPPDAVMTTVTTTKIDTTKKPAQNAQATAAQPSPSGRTIVRNFVAPMPVDDGRIFDVGGFYTPADPVDLGITDEDTDKKN
ncbi:MAG: hypothetical protein K2O44_03420 [Clostridia bacterium]|nr:hypothetical protein [Clostridia bacterium]